MTALEPGELLTHVVLPPLADGEGVGYQSLQLGTDSWALARASCLVRANGTISAARVVLGCAEVPVRQPAMEAALVGLEPRDAAGIAAAAALAGEDFHPPSDAHATVSYRTAMARVMARRAVEGSVA